MNELDLLKKEVIDFFTDPDKQIFKLQGGPGTGKSHSVISIISAFTSIRDILCLFDAESQKVTKSNVFITATTHKAVAALSPIVTQIEQNHSIAVYLNTVHAFLGLKGYNCSKTGKLILKKDTKGVNVTIDKNSLVILDEASYANKQIYSLLMELLDSRKDVKLLIIMDSRQGKVIGEGLSNFVTEVEQSFEILTRRRYPQNSAIHLNSLMLEDLIDGKEQIKPFIEDDTFEVISREYAQELIEEGLIDGNEDLRIIAFRNTSVVAYNNMIHTSKYHNNHFNVGQVLTSPEYQKVDDVSIPNDASYTVQEVDLTPVKHEFTTYFGKHYSIDCYRIKLKGIPNFFKVPQDFKKYNSIMYSLSITKEWSALFNFKASVLDLRHAWSITCYKSQGSSYDYVIVDTPDLEGIEDLDDFYRMLNVSITRARKKTFIIASN